MDTPPALRQLPKRDGNRGEESHRSLIYRSASLNLERCDRDARSSCEDPQLDEDEESACLECARAAEANKGRA